MFGKVLLTVTKVAIGLVTAYALYRVCASESCVPEVVGSGEVPKEEEEEELEEEVHEDVGLADGSEEIPLEDNGGVMPNNEQVTGADRVVQGQGSHDLGKEVPEEDGGSAMPNDEQVMVADRVVQGQGSQDVVQEVPIEDNAADEIQQEEVVDEVHGEEEDDRNGGGEGVAHEGVVAPPILFNDEQNMYGIDFEYKIPCDNIISFLPGWAPRFVFGGPMLGQGAFGAVQLSQDEYGSMCAVKTVQFVDDFEAQSAAPQLEKEIELQAACAGPHVIGAYGRWGSDYEMNLAFEFGRFGAMDSQVFQESDTEGRAMPEDRAAYVIRDVARALMTCHQRGVVHCDVKLANILFCEDGVLKLSDFGLAVRVEEDGMTDVRTFEPQFAAPELKGDGRYGVKVDLWALGIMMYELMRGTRRWHLAICAPGRGYIPEERELEADARDLLNKLLSEDPNDRPSAGEVLAHSWVTRNTTQGL